MSSDATVPSFWLSLPEGFTGIDLAEDPGERMGRVLDGLDVLTSADPEQKLGIAVAAETALQAQLREGAVHVSSCLVQAEDGSVVQGMLTFFVRSEALDPPGTYPQRAAEQLARAWPDADVAVIDFPLGRAVVTVRDLAVPVPGAAYGLPGSGVTTVRQLEVLLAHPWSPHVLAAVFTTEHLDHWEGWLTLVGTAINGISFYPPRNEAPDDTVRMDPAGRVAPELPGEADSPAMLLAFLGLNAVIDGLVLWSVQRPRPPRRRETLG
ncbi:hypothetical protein AB0D10_33550 [Kitasatospora sp. NPDC048545]|uniref:hypothetical protein n=1 Tax=Kitasatospora sp. NPDC048545 TaxID=3157208 RepID=UPI00340EF751